MSARLIAMVMAACMVAQADAAGEAIDGQALFDRHCVHCHGADPEAPGTLQLARRLGADRALLTAREELTPAYIQTVVRNGLKAMPPFPPSDLDDARLEALSEYLTR